MGHGSGKLPFLAILTYMVQCPEILNLKRVQKGTSNGVRTAQCTVASRVKRPGISPFSCPPWIAERKHDRNGSALVRHTSCRADWDRTCGGMVIARTFLAVFLKKSRFMRHQHGTVNPLCTEKMYADWIWSRLASNSIILRVITLVSFWRFFQSWASWKARRKRNTLSPHLPPRRS